MKLFKRIYYPLIAVLVVVMTVFSILTSSNLKADATLTTAQTNKLNEYVTAMVEKTTDYDRGEYVRTTLRSDSGADVQDNEYNYYTGDNSQSAESKATYKLDAKGVPQPTVVRHRPTINPTLTEEGYFVNYSLINYIVVIPGSVTKAKYADLTNEALSYGDATLFVAHYGTDTTLANTVSNAVSVASIMMEIERICAEKVENKNDLVFLFTAGGENGSLGATAFKEQFKGYDDIYSRVKAVVAFDTVGSNPAVLLGETGDDGATMATAFAKVGGKTYASSLTAELFGGVYGADDFDAFSDLNSVEITSLGNNTEGTIYDVATNVNANLVNGVATAVRGTVEYFANANLDKEGGSLASAYFNYLGGTVVYSAILPYVLGGVIVLLLASVIYFAIAKKAFCFKALGKGVAVSVLSLLATLISAVIAYFIIGLIGSGFGVVDVHALTTVVKANIGVIVFALAFMTAISIAFFALFKKVFGVDSASVSRGNALIVALASIITAYAFPQGAHLTIFSATLMLIVMLVEVLLNDKFEQKTGVKMEKLHLYAIPSALIIPMILSEAFVLTSIAPLVILPVILSVAVMTFASVTVYADDFKQAITNILPKHTVVEKKEKNGKSVSIKRKVSTNYSTSFGVTVVSALCIVAVALFALLGNIGFGSASETNFTYRDAIYKDALVYVVDGNETTVEIADTSVYKIVSPYADGFKWNAEKNAYVLKDAPTLAYGELTVKADENNAKKIIVSSTEKADYDYKVTLSGFTAGSITKVTFDTGSGNDTYKKEYDLSALNEVTVTFTVPKDYGADGNGFNIEIEGSATTVTVDVERRSDDVQNKQNNTLWQVVSYAYSDNAIVYDNLKLNLITKASGTFTLA